MNRVIILAALLSTAAPALAQNIQGQTSQSASGAEANSGSISGASSDNHNANINAGIGNSESQSNSNSTAVSGSISGSQSNGNEQGQSQGQSANNSQGQGQDQAQQANNTQGQGQDQGQSQSNDSNNSSSQGQMQDQTASNANSQGVTVNQTWNTKNRKTTEVRTNNAVPLAASSSFSSDYCGGTVSGGVSAAPLGISIGGSGTKYDASCQSLRRAEKFGMAAANAHNMGQQDLAGRLMSMMIWSICTSDSGGPSAVKNTAQACDQLLLLGANHSQASAVPAQPLATKAREAQVAIKGQITAEAASKANDDQKVASAGK